jgi:polyhydroxyalkanoate synthase
VDLLVKNILLTGTTEEVGAELQKSYDRMLDSTKKWLEILQFEPAPQTGLSPKEVVWKKNKARLYRYISTAGYQHRIPVLMVYALINKPYILDLIPGMSLVEYLIGCGYDVFLLDWGDFGWEDRNLNIGDLVSDYIARAAQKTAQIANSSEITILGYCMGGTMTSMYAALHSRPTIKNMIFLSAPMSFENCGAQSAWLQSPGYDADRIVDTLQLIPRDFIDYGVKMLRPVTNYWGTYTRLWKSIDEDAPLTAWKALNKWVNDNINFPGEAYRQWIKDLYQTNKLVQNEFFIRGQSVDVSKIEANLLVMAGQKDHLVLPGQASAILKYVSSQDKAFYDLPVGHGGLVFGNYARQHSYPIISGWLDKRSD